MKHLIISTISLLTLFSSIFAFSYIEGHNPYQTENGDIYGWDNDNDGRSEYIYVSGYYKSDGTYVRSHYRAK